MANILYIPFYEKGEGEIREWANELAEYGVSVYYYGDNFTVKAGDILVVNAHGSPKTTTAYDNQGEETELDVLLSELKKMKAHKAERVIFFICFSAQGGHVANQFKKLNTDTEVWGSLGVAQGPVAKTTRTGIHGGLFGNDYKRLTEM